MHSDIETLSFAPWRRMLTYRGQAFHILVIVLLAILVYSNTFHVPFLFDDVQNIVENPAIKDLGHFVERTDSKSSPRINFSTRYVGHLSFALNYKLHGLNVIGYHVLNLMIHCANALLLYFLIVLSFRTPFMERPPLKKNVRNIALFAALFFVCHPVQTQAVTYTVQRFASLATFFYLASLVAYIKARLAAKKNLCTVFYAMSLISAILAMKTKEISLTLPLIIGLFELFFFKGSIKSRVPYLVPVAFTILIIPLSLLDIDKPLGEFLSDVSQTTKVATEMSRFDYLFTQFRVIMTYLRLLFFPLNQNLDYDYPIHTSFFAPEVFFSFLFLLLIFALGVFLFIRSRRSQPEMRLIAFGIFWFFITLSIESSIFPIVDVIFEHRLYLPTAGFFAAAVTLTFVLIKKLGSQRIRRATVCTSVLALVILSFATYNRNAVWQDEIRLWEDVVRKSPRKARPHNNLGSAYYSHGIIDRAIGQYQKALDLRPEYALAHYNLGVSFHEKGWTDRALKHFKTAQKLKPSFAKTYPFLGDIYKSQGLTDKAMMQYQMALKLNHDNAQVHFNLGTIYGMKGLLDRAIEHFKTAVRIMPSFAEAHNNLGNAYLLKGLVDDAMDEYLIAVHLRPENKEAHYNLYLVYKKKGMKKKAEEYFNRAKSLNPHLIK